MGTKLRRLWRDIQFHNHKKKILVEDPEKFEAPLEEGQTIATHKAEIHIVPQFTDPSLRDQLYERSSLREGEQLQSYLNACEKAPHASEGTKRKWKRALGIA